MKQNHIIQKVFIEITVNNKEKAYGIKDDINSFLSIDVFPEIEKYINSIEHKLAGHTLQIPRLELNFDINNSSLNAELKDRITQLFKEELSEIAKHHEMFNQETESGSKAYWVSNQEKLVQTFIYFLENGCMPWWNSDENSINFFETAVFDSLISAPSFQKSIVSVLPKQHIQRRIINQLTDVQIAQLCLKISENKQLQINLDDEIILHISKLKHADRTFVWHMVLRVLLKYLHSSATTDLREYFLEEVSKAEQIKWLQVKSNLKNLKALAGIFPFVTENEIAESIENTGLTKNIGTVEDQKPNKYNIKDYPKSSKIHEEIINQSLEEIHNDGIMNDGQYVQNAGLILIHPFIKTFFEHCDLLRPENQKLTDPELGVHLLHYIATGNVNPPEYDMVFEKFLCNIPMHQSINRHIKLSRKHKTQAKNVIESVQHNWSPMKKSSAALLQNEFFQRSGKLLVTDHDYTLTVERKTQDILLEKLAWGIGLVKLPWKEKFILVNW
ncbi:hypothetical protein QF023_000399 [Chryseobacterium sp. SLBN-27]|uniref:contractile injection system tape measure protein n=1 Tax=Chryseobacterium sp. SLBN-27 TaxID=3042287 RepID=UPI00285F86EE|nr:contractile injection system tape measure protein [Chryseobacterium sp. SLBN-27]MDR6156883.1 hypothetical protein [Chryseobacterium sp. SLBN-27]